MLSTWHNTKWIKYFFIFAISIEQALTIGDGKNPKLTRVHTYRHKEFLDLVHSVCHAQVTIRNGGKNLNINVQLHGQMGIFWISTLPQLLLLHMRLQQQKHLILVTVNLVFSVSSAFMFSYMDSTVYLVFVSHRAFPQHWNLGPRVFLQTFNCASLRPQNLAYKIKLRTKYKLDAQTMPIQAYGFSP